MPLNFSGLVLVEERRIFQKQAALFMRAHAGRAYCITCFCGGRN